MKMNIVNCFSTQEANSGNPAAIVRNFSGNEDEKQELARKLNLPVTIFLSEIIDGICNIKYFYPETEMALCLHGTSGAAFMLSKEKKLADLILLTKNKIRLKTRIIENVIQVLVSSQSVVPINIDTLNICNMLNVSDGDIDFELPFLIASVGSAKLLLPLKSYELLRTLKPRLDLIAEWSIENGVNGFYVYTKEANNNDLNFYARGFNPKGGHQEDAATGVAAAALSLALKQSIVVGQGIFLNRPSKIIVSYANENNIWVGGEVQEEIRNENIQFKKMSEIDFDLLHRWFQIPHVQKWYTRDTKYTLEMIEKKYLPRIHDATIQSFIIHHRDKPVGYIQFYYLTDHLPEGMHYEHPLFNDFKPNELAGIDFFIADNNYLRRGFSSEALTLFINTYLKKKFKAVLVDPLKHNIIAISFFQRNAFKHIMNQDANHELMILKLE